MNDKEKEALKGKGQRPAVDNCFGCDSPFLPTYNLLDYIKYFWVCIKTFWGVNWW